MNGTISRVALLFAGGPAPAANAVISTCAASFLKNNIRPLGIRHGYSALEKFDAAHPLQLERDYFSIDSNFLRRTRNTQGILIGTSRANPGKRISSPAHLDDLERCQPLRNVYQGLRSLEVDALVSIGGDDTLKTANKFKLFQDRYIPEGERIPVVHVPKTIDNDYAGIDFTFGFFTAVEVLATEVRNLLYDAESTRSYFVCEVMGRSAGWLSYGTAIAGEASLVLSVEDIDHPESKLLTTEIIEHPKTKEKIERKIMKVDEVVKMLVQLMQSRDKKGKPFGVIVLAEGLAEYLPDKMLKRVIRDQEGNITVGPVDRDDHNHIKISQVDMGKQLADRIAIEYEKATGKSRKVIGLQLGYESRCAQPRAYDVLLGSQLGVGAYRALNEQKLNGYMVSVEGQLELRYEPFEKLVDPKSLVTVVRKVQPKSDFHRLVRFLETELSE